MPRPVPEDRDRLTGEPLLAREVFEQAPVAVCGLAGPDHLIVAINGAYRAMTGRRELVGSTVADLYPESVRQGIAPVFDRVYATGVAESKKAWRMQLMSDQGLQEFSFDFTVTPWYDRDGVIAGVTVFLADATEQVRRRQAAESRAAEAEARYKQARSTLTTLQQALLPPDLPLLPQLNLAARYVLAERDTAAGGDWYDTVGLSDGRVALVVGDVVGHGVQASAVMGQLRTVVQERLRAGCSPAQALQAVDAHARHVPGAQAATCCVTVVDPSGRLCYASAGHPSPLLIAPDGSTAFLPGSGQGPLATGATYSEHDGQLPDDATVLLYTDGIIERPGLTPEAGRRKLASTARDAALDRLMPRNSPCASAERIVNQTLEILLRDTGHSDDVTLLAAHRGPAPHDLHVVLPATVESTRTIQFELGRWLVALGCRGEDESALQHSVVELVTNAVDHAYGHPDAEGVPREVTVHARIVADGTCEIEVADHGRWSQADRSDRFRGRGLAMVEMFTDTFTVDRGGAGSEGTTVRISRGLRKAVTVTEGTRTGVPQQHELTLRADPDVPGLLNVRGTVDTTTAQRLIDRLMTASRGGTVSLTVNLDGVTHLASAGVQVLHHAATVLDDHGQALILHASPGSVAATVLDLAALRYRTGPSPEPGE